MSPTDRAWTVRSSCSQYALELREESRLQQVKLMLKKICYVLEDKRTSPGQEALSMSARSYRGTLLFRAE
jgi:hypothetical protein